MEESTIDNVPRSTDSARLPPNHPRALRVLRKAQRLLGLAVVMEVTSASLGRGLVAAINLLARSAWAYWHSAPRSSEECALAA